jgi:hypothetical protein
MRALAGGPVVALPSMAKVARTATKKVRPGRWCKFARIYTGWHPVLVALLEHVPPGGFMLERRQRAGMGRLCCGEGAASHGWSTKAPPATLSDDGAADQQGAVGWSQREGAAEVGVDGQGLTVDSSHVHSTRIEQ